MSQPVRVIQCGLGAIGRATARLVLERPSLQLIGAVDNNPQLVGRDLGEVLELPGRLGVAVTRELPAGVVVIHCTTSKFEDCAAQIADFARAGMHCVTSCEEALFPSYRHRELAEQLDATCRQHGVAAVGTGVNPGFVMDTLPVVLTAVCRRVDAMRVLRVVDAGTRREALQRKVGAGITVEEFYQRVKAGTLRHVGLPESLAFVAAALGWPTGDIKEVIEPVLRPDGRVAGVKQVATAGTLTLELQMYVGAPQPRDEIEIAGDPPLHLVMQGGTPGDVATPAILVNMISRVLEAQPGFHTMRTLALPGIAA